MIRSLKMPVFDRKVDDEHSRIRVDDAVPPMYSPSRLALVPWGKGFLHWQNHRARILRIQRERSDEAKRLRDSGSNQRVMTGQATHQLPQFLFLSID